MATYSTLEEIKTGMQDDLFADDLITLRSEQRDAIDQAKERFCKRSGRRGEYQYEVLPEYRQFLWNAKMRFGKTICAMQLMRELDVKRTLIITHRPVVGESWLKAFKQVVGSKSSEPKVKGNSDIHKTYAFGMRSDDESETVGNFYDLQSLSILQAITMPSLFRCNIFVSLNLSTARHRQKMQVRNWAMETPHPRRTRC